MLHTHTNNNQCCIKKTCAAFGMIVKSNAIIHLCSSVIKNTQVLVKWFEKKKNHIVLCNVQSQKNKQNKTSQ